MKRRGRGRAAIALATPLALAFAIAISAAGCGGAEAEAGGAKSPSSGSAASASKAIDFTGRDLDGKTFHLADHLGREVIVLDFWATWCEPCKEEFPHLKRLYEANKAKGLLVVGVAMDTPDTSKQVYEVVKSHDIPFPIVVDEDSSIANLYNPKKSAPLTIVIDKSGAVVDVHDGYNPGDETLLADAVAKVLDPSRAGK